MFATIRRSLLARAPILTCRFSWMRQRSALRERRANPLPAIVSVAWGDRAPAHGDLFAVNLGQVRPIFVVAGVRETFPGMRLDRPFVIASTGAIEEVGTGVNLIPSVLYVRAPADAQPLIESTVIGTSRLARVTAQNQLVIDRRQRPFVRGVDRVFGWAFALSVVFAIGGSVAALALTAANRRRDFGYMRTMGLTTRQAVGLTVVEQLPPLVTASAVGAVLAIVTAAVFEPGIDLASFAGPRLVDTLRIDGLAIGITVVGLVGVMAIAVGIFGWISRRENLGALLRLGDE